METSGRKTLRASLRQQGIELLARLPLTPAFRMLPHGKAQNKALTVANLRLKRHPKHFTARQTRHGFHMSGSTDDLILRYIYLFGSWEPSLSKFVERHLRAGDIAIDVGANVGYFTLLAASRVGDAGHVIAYEPYPPSLEAAQANAEANNLSNITFLPIAASDKPGEVQLFMPPPSSTGVASTDDPSGQLRSLSVPCGPIADTVDPALWPRVSLIKIDIEGDELRAVRGCIPLLKAMLPGSAVVTELSPERLERRGQSSAELVGLLTDLGYDPYVIANDYSVHAYLTDPDAPPMPMLEVPSEQTDVVFVKRSGDGSNTGR